mmetsp:Transcript_17620/g.22981  ORF Transcript_17620/g.22981 Transcript_17620/m.22981 type:complete len:359 (-) Transcript_17620:122-1198(-)
MLPATPKVWVNPATGERTDGLGPGTWKVCDEDEFVQGFVGALQTEGVLLSFTEVTARLTRLALSYQFILPPWLLFVVRAVITFDGVAESLSPPLSALDFAAPHAARRVLAPLTPQGEADLRALLTKNDEDYESPCLDLEKFRNLGVDSPLVSEGAGLAPREQALATVAVDLLLKRSDGRALRKLIADINPVPLTRLAATQATTLAFSIKPLPKWIKQYILVKKNKQLSTPSHRLWQSEDTTLMPADVRFFAPKPSPPRPPPAWRASKVRSILIGTHIPSLVKSPQAIANLFILSTCVALIVLRVAIVNSPPGYLFRQIIVNTRRWSRIRIRKFREMRLRRKSTRAEKKQKLSFSLIFP